MWTGTDPDYFHLDSTAAKDIKRRLPQLGVGGPDGEHRPAGRRPA